MVGNREMILEEGVVSFIGALNFRDSCERKDSN